MHELGKKKEEEVKEAVKEVEGGVTTIIILYVRVLHDTQVS